MRQAIQNESESYETYTGAAHLAEDQRVREGLQRAAREERQHQAMLERLLADWDQLPASFRHLGHRTIEHEPAGEQSEGEIRELFEALAQEELRHEYLFRRWYEKAMSTGPKSEQ